MLLWVSIASAVCEDTVIEDLIPLGGEIRKTAFVRVRTGLLYPEAEIASVEEPERVYQLTDRLAEADRPEGWVAFEIPDGIPDEDYTLSVWDAGEQAGSQEYRVFQLAEIGELAEDLEWLDTRIDPSEFNPVLCDDEAEAAWHLVTLTLESPERPGNGWLIEVAQGDEPRAWMAMPEFGGEVVLYYYLHWTEEEACPTVNVYDPFHALQATYGGDCLVLPDIPGPGDTDSPRFDVACGCGAPISVGPWLLGLLVLRRRRR